jgi:hypothetical protein
MRNTTLSLTAAFTLATLQATAQTSGVANPPEAMVNDTPAPESRPSPAAVPAQAPPSDLRVETRPVPTMEHRVPLTPSTPAVDTTDEDAYVVTETPTLENEIPVGTILRVRLNQDLSTITTVPGTALLGELTADLMRGDRVMLPAGTPFAASVTQVRGGRRVHGAALLHIESRSIRIGDATYPIHASVIDTDQFNDMRVDSEGNLIRRDHVGATLAAMSLTTGGAAAAGAVLGGVPGALVGAGIGAGASTVWWLKQDRQMKLGKDTTVVFQTTSPIFLNSTRANGAE